MQLISTFSGLKPLFSAVRIEFIVIRCKSRKDTVTIILQIYLVVISAAWTSEVVFIEVLAILTTHCIQMDRQPVLFVMAAPTLEMIEHRDHRHRLLGDHLDTDTLRYNIGCFSVSKHYFIFDSGVGSLISVANHHSIAELAISSAAGL